MTALPPEVEQLQEDAGSLVPAITTILTAATAYAASKRAVTDVETALELTAKAGAALTNVALRMLALLLKGAKSRASREALLEASDAVVGKAVADGMKVISTAMEAIIEGQRQVMKQRAKTKVNPPGVPYVPVIDVPGDSDNPEVLARRVAQTVRNSATYHAGEAIESAGVTLYKTWHDVGDQRVRATHAFLGSRTYEFHRVPLASAFVTVAGNKLLFPGDPSAPLSETRHCRCWLTYSET